MALCVVGHNEQLTFAVRCVVTSIITLSELTGGTNGTGGNGAWYCSWLGFGSLVPSSSGIGLGNRGSGATREAC